MSTINLTAHGLTAGQRVVFSSIAPSGTGLVADVVYTVLAAGMTANSFQVSETGNESDPLTLSANVTSASMAVVPETTTSDPDSASYVPVTDTGDVHAPPTAPPVPPVPTVSSALVAGISRLRVVMSVTAEAKLRAFEVQITNRYSSGIAISGSATGVAATDIITLSAHGLVAGDKVRFTSLTGGSGLTAVSPDYWVISTNLTTNTFMVSLTAGGAAVDFTTDITAGSAEKVVTSYTDWTTPAIYTLPEGSTELSIPCLGTTSYSVRVRAVDVYGQFSAFCSEVQHTTVAGNDSLTAALAAMSNDVQDGIITTTKIADSAISTAKLQANSVTAQVLAATIVLTSLIKTSPTSNAGPANLLTGVAATDLLTSTGHGLVAGDRVRFLALTGGAGLTANAIDYFVIATGLTANDFKVSATSGGSAVDFTTDITAGTVGKVLRRVEIDTAGVRLLDVDDSLIVNIPTNGDPVYIRGKMDADTITVQTSTTMRGTISHESSSVDTLQNGVAAPSATPSLAASVEALTLTSSPSNPYAGIGYDSAAGTFWIACNPTVSPYYVAQEFSATTGALVRSISATGSITTVTATAGSTTHVSDTADGLVGSTASHITTPIVCPTVSGASNYQMTKVAVWMAGRSGTCSTRNGVWSTSNVGLRESATYTAASGGATTVGASELHNQTLSSPLSITPGTTYRVGFRRMNTTDGSQHDKDDGASKTTYSGDGTTFDGTGWVTRDSAGKPNAYFTYTYDLDTRKETAAMIGVATDGTYVYTLDTNGVVWKYDRSTLAWVANSSVQTAITGTKSLAGMFYDSTAGELIITTATTSAAGAYPKFVRVTPSTLAVSTTVYSASAGQTFNGGVDTFRGGARVADALNASAATYWIATTSAVYAYTFSGTTATQTTSRDFGLSTTVSSGLTHDGTVFRGYNTSTPTSVWKFTAWDWTTASDVYWVGYSWYDSNATGGTHETAAGPRASITMRRHERLQVQNANIPTGGTDDPNNVRIYMAPGAADWAAGSGKLQVTDALTSRFITNYSSGGAADGAGTAFPSGTAAILKSSATGWTLKGDGTVNVDVSQPIGGKPPVVNVYTSTGANTWTKPTGLSFIVVEVIGAGGAGGGSIATGVGENAGGGGGGAGGYARKTFTAANLSGASSFTATVGAGGTGVSGAAGNSGALSSFSGTGITTVQGNGGTGGNVGTNTTTSALTTPVVGGTASGGNFNVQGGAGGGGGVIGGIRLPTGNGGNSALGGGGIAGNNAVGGAGGQYGAGGGGSTRAASSAAQAGGAGANGVVIVTEFYGA